MMEEKVIQAICIDWHLHRVRKLQYAGRETIRTITIKRFVSAIRAKVKCIYCMEDCVNKQYRTIDDISYDESGE